MTGLCVATSFVLPDEKVGWFAETWRRTPDKGDRRVQRMTVRRNGQMAVYEEDVGPFDVQRDHVFNAPCFWEYSVAEMRELAMLSRDNKPLREPEEHIDLKATWIEQLERNALRRGHKSVIGPHFRKERH